MLLVNRDRIGAAAFDRLAREGLIHDVLGAWALPADIPATGALRARMIDPLVPPHTWVTGLGALWLYGFASVPTRLDLTGPRGHPRLKAAQGSPPLVYRGGTLDGLRTDAGSPRAASVTRACLDALAHNPASLALPATAWALRRRATGVRDLRAMLRRMDPRTPGRTRVIGLVEALAAR